MIIEYDILQSNREDFLISKVNHAIKDGWEPLGGLADKVGSLRQVMVKRDYSKVTSVYPPLSEIFQTMQLDISTIELPDLIQEPVCNNMT